MNGRTCLYRMYDAAGALLYVGITNRPDLRFAQHAADKPWWREVKTIKKQWYDVRECVPDLTAQRCNGKPCAGHAEIAAIKRERPRYNIEHNMSNPHRVPYRKLNAPARPVRRRARRGKIKRMSVSAWVWVAVCALLMALTTAVGVWAGVLGLTAVLASRYGWERYGAPALRDTRDSWKAIRQRR